MSSALTLTPGLLVSMALRKDHLVFAPDLEPDDPLAAFMIRTPWHERVPAAIDAARDAYDAAVLGTLDDDQVLEEVVGTGFYAPAREERYLSIVDGFAGMADYARLRATPKG